MLIALIKKEIKQFFRSPGDVVMLFVFPIMLITVLSVGLKNLMNGETNLFLKDGEKSIVYYTLSDNSIYKDGINEFIKGVENSIDVEVKEVKSLDEVKEDVNNYKALLHVGIYKDAISIYSSNKGEKLNAKVFRQIFESTLNEYAVYGTIYKYNPKAVSKIVQNKYESYVKEDSEKSRDVTAGEFYTFAELALILLFVGQNVGERVYKETQLRTIDRIRLSKVGEGTIIASKIGFGVIIAIIQILLVYAYTSTVLKIDWGSYTLEFLLLFLVFGIFTSIIGAIIGFIAKSDSTVGGMMSTVIFVICFLGGCYTPLSMIITIPVLNKLAYFTPIYWITTATSTMICGYESNAYIIALIIPIVLSIISLSVYLTIVKKRGVFAND